MKTLRHYLLFGAPGSPATRAMLVSAQTYIARFAPAFGFELAAASNAQNVTIVGDSRAVDAAADTQLQSLGCRVDRLDGDQYAVSEMLSDRVRRNAEYGGATEFPPD